MKFADINIRYTEIVTEWLAKGYTINTRTMSGSQGEIANIDLTNGTEIVRILVDTFSDWNAHIEGVEIVVGRATDADVRPHNESGWATIWNNRLEVIFTERFYKIGVDRNSGTFYGSSVEAKAANVIRLSRYKLRCNNTSGSILANDKAVEIAKSIIRREFGVKRITESDIRINKSQNSYVIGYRGKTYRLH